MVVELIQKIDPSLDIEYFRKQSSSHSASSLRYSPSVDQAQAAKLSIAEMRDLVQFTPFFDIENAQNSIGDLLFSENFIEALKSDAELRGNLIRRLPYVERFIITRELILHSSSFHPYYDEFVDTLGWRRGPTLSRFEKGPLRSEEDRLRRALEAMEILNEDAIQANYYVDDLVRKMYAFKSQDPVVLELRRMLAIKVLEASEDEVLNWGFLKEGMIVAAIKIDSSVPLDMQVIDEERFNRLIQYAEQREQFEIIETLKKLRKASPEEN